MYFKKCQKNGIEIILLHLKFKDFSYILVEYDQKIQKKAPWYDFSFCHI